MTISFDQGKICHLGTLTIPNGDNSSNVMTAATYQGFSMLTFVAPAALTNTLSLEVMARLSDDETDDASWRDNQSVPGTDDDLPADKAITIPTPAAPALRLTNQTTNEGGDRLIEVWGIR